MLIQVAATLYIGGDIGGDGGSSDDYVSGGGGYETVPYVPPGIAALLSILHIR